MATKYSFEQKPGESLEKYYRRIAKVADQRLVRLERLAQKEGYGAIEQWSYARAMTDIQTWSGSDATRFNTKPPDNTNALKAKINDIKTFLGSETSTKGGIDTVYKNRVNTINERYGTSFQTDDLAKVFSDSLLRKMQKKGYGSKEILRAIGFIQNNTTDEDSLKAMQAEARKRKTVPTFTGDPFEDELIASMLRSKTTVSEMYQFFKAIK